MKKKKLDLRDRSLWPIYIWFVVNVVAFYGGRLLTWGRTFYDLTLPVDRMIPVWTPAVIPYIGTFAFWGIGFLALSQMKDSGRYYSIMAAELVAKLLCFLIFLILPTKKVLPEISGNGICDRLLRLIYFLDEPNMLFPSVHCLDSFVILRGVMGMKQVKKTTRISVFVITAAIFASTLLTGQHVFVDTVAAVVVVEIGFYAAKKWRLGSRYEKWISSIRLREPS